MKSLKSKFKILPLCALLSLQTILPCIGATIEGPVPKPEDTVKVDEIVSKLDKTSEEYCFQLEEAETVDYLPPTFILLDSNPENLSSTFFITTKEKYGSRHFNATDRVNSKFDPLDSQSIAYWLNDKTDGFLKNGNSFGNQKGNVSKLPQAVVDHIDFQHSWETECGSEDDLKTGEAVLGGKSYHVTCGVSLLSYTEFMKYKGFLGYRDRVHENASGVVADPEKTSSVYYGWWLRSPAPNTKGEKNLCVGSGVPEWAGKLKATRNAKRANCDLAVRPAFYLNREFFLHTKLNMTTLGIKVKEILAKQYKRSEFVGLGYTKEELDSIFGEEQHPAPTEVPRNQQQLRDQQQLRGQQRRQNLD